AAGGPKNRVKETVPPSSIVRCSRRSVTFPHGCVGSSFPPISKQLVQFDSFRTGRRHRHVHGQANGCDRRARRNCSRNIEREYAAAEFTHAILTSEEVKASAIAVIAFCRIVLIKRVVFARVDNDNGRTSGHNTGTTERSKYCCE